MQEGRELSPVLKRDASEHSGLRTLTGQQSSIHCHLCLPTLIAFITGPKSRPQTSLALHQVTAPSLAVSCSGFPPPLLSTPPWPKLHITMASPSSALPSCPHSAHQKTAPGVPSGPLPWSTSKPDGGCRVRGLMETKSRLKNFKYVLQADGTALAKSSGAFLWPECRVTEPPQRGFLSTASP